MRNIIPGKTPVVVTGNSNLTPVPRWAATIDATDGDCVSFERRSAVPVAAFPDVVGAAPDPVTVVLAQHSLSDGRVEGPLVNLCVHPADGGGHPGVVFTVEQARQLRAALDELLDAAGPVAIALPCPVAVAESILAGVR